MSTSTRFTTNAPTVKEPSLRNRRSSLIPSASRPSVSSSSISGKPLSPHRGINSPKAVLTSPKSNVKKLASQYNRVRKQTSLSCLRSVPSSRSSTVASQKKDTLLHTSAAKPQTVIVDEFGVVQKSSRIGSTLPLQRRSSLSRAPLHHRNSAIAATLDGRSKTAISSPVSKVPRLRNDSSTPTKPNTSRSTNHTRATSNLSHSQSNIPLSISQSQKSSASPKSNAVLYSSIEAKKSPSTPVHRRNITSTISKEAKVEEAARPRRMSLLQQSSRNLQVKPRSSTAKAPSESTSPVKKGQSSVIPDLQAKDNDAIHVHDHTWAQWQSQIIIKIDMESDLESANGDLELFNTSRNTQIMEGQVMDEIEAEIGRLGLDRSGLQPSSDSLYRKTLQCDEVKLDFVMQRDDALKQVDELRDLLATTQAKLAMMEKDTHQEPIVDIDPGEEDAKLEVAVNSTIILDMKEQKKATRQDAANQTCNSPLPDWERKSNTLLITSSFEEAREEDEMVVRLEEEVAKAQKEVIRDGWRYVGFSAANQVASLEVQIAVCHHLTSQLDFFQQSLFQQVSSQGVMKTAM